VSRDSDAQPAREVASTTARDNRGSRSSPPLAGFTGRRRAAPDAGPPGAIAKSTPTTGAIPLAWQAAANRTAP